MDRFIAVAVLFVFNYVIVRLKSNMDRFIDSSCSCSGLLRCSLKSNMDRFIVTEVQLELIRLSGLKSNMDRFIDKFVAKVCLR